MQAHSTADQNKLAYGSSKENGAVPKMENQIMFRLPKRSAKGPPINVPKAPAANKVKIMSCAFPVAMPK
ncbi:hypothetical protein D3C85_1228210 [compost metagenome]